MAKIKLTKNELKAQRDGMKRFLRYLPTLQLKKQQLQLEARLLREAMAKVVEQQRRYEAEVAEWIGILGDEGAERLAKFIEVEEWRVSSHNIAGIDTPVFEAVVFKPATYDLFSEPLWVDAAREAVCTLVEIKLRHRTLQEQLDLIEQELRVVTQRVNLFEKVKIPEAKENIRVIQIYLGDQQTNAVGRSKIAKGKCAAREQATEMALGSAAG
ncbi:MAG: V-type ATP synthase subunit D [Lentisphaeria bacterium]|nr:V-type ATP synthase subunit D [Lentisphaeria bacterium]